MYTSIRKSILAVGIVACASGFATHAHAGCAIDDWGSTAASGWLQQQAIVGRGGLTLAAASAGFSHDRPFSFRSIVGLWRFTFTSQGTSGIPDGTVLDAGYATWHSDGTELMNSSRPPPSSNFCMGVWKQLGRATYKLNHFALSWDPTGQVFVGPANIREVVTVDRTGNSYEGTFVIDQFAEDGVTMLVHLTGTIDATRVTVD